MSFQASAHLMTALAAAFTRFQMLAIQVLWQENLCCQQVSSNVAPARFTAMLQQTRCEWFSVSVQAGQWRQSLLPMPMPMPMLVSHGEVW